mmetsp:Transcript_67994/g.159957  ORF Transcript_67994/g.159957 Transcript_67994/m.159957 type:complete len:332 (-) Transcript_67994:75-1070(-)
MITPCARGILVSWLQAVLEEFAPTRVQAPRDEINEEHSCIYLFDMFCLKWRFPLRLCHLQMFGAACVVLSLHPCTSPPFIPMREIERVAWYTDGACTSAELKNAVHLVTQTLARPATGVPTMEEHTMAPYLHRLLAIMGKEDPSSSTFCMVHYFAELSLQSELVLRRAPAVLAAACFALACHTLGWEEHRWAHDLLALEHYEQYEGDDDDEEESISHRWSDTGLTMTLSLIAPAMFELLVLHKRASTVLHNCQQKTVPHVVSKYCQRRWSSVAWSEPSDAIVPEECPHGAPRVVQPATDETDIRDGTIDVVSGGCSPQCWALLQGVTSPPG